MTEANHPLEDEAHALIDDVRFHQWLDATGAGNGWPNHRFSARRWLLYQCGIESVGYLAVDPEAAAAFDQIARRFAAWDSNGELEV